MLTELLINVSHEPGSRVDNMKKWGPEQGTFIDGWLSGELNRDGAWTGVMRALSRKTDPKIATTPKT